MPASAASFTANEGARGATTPERRRAASGSAATAAAPKQYSVQTKATIPPPPVNDPALRILPTHDRFAEQYQDPRQRPAANTNTPATAATYGDAYTATPDTPPATLRPRPRRRAGQTVRRKLRKRFGPKASLATARVSGVNGAIWSWGIWSWLFFQVPLALLSLTFLGMAYAIREIINSLVGYEDGEFTSAIGKFGVQVFGSFIEAANYVVSEIFGFELSTLDPLIPFILLHMLVWFFGLFTLMLIGICYKLALLRPLGGRSSGLKYAAVLLAVVGYAVPIANLFPWFMVWTMVVWVNPK